MTAFAEYTGFSMNTEVTWKIYNGYTQNMEESTKAELARLENMLSRFVPDSEITQINQSAGKESVAISDETFEILSAAVRLSVLSQGAFDITIGPLIDLWDYKHATQPPEGTKIRQTLDLVNFRDLLLDEDKCTAKLRKAGQSIDLGGIGKGYASDRCLELFARGVIESAFVNIGGNVSVLGSKPDGTAWRVGIRHPRQNGNLIGAVEASGESVVTSGDYERFFIDLEGRCWHHILNPISGYPADSGLISATVIAADALMADALSTAIFIAGMERGLGLLHQFPQTEAVLIDQKQQVFITQGLKDRYQSADRILVSAIL
mgnify:CR=1 FL=1